MKFYCSSPNISNQTFIYLVLYFLNRMKQFLNFISSIGIKPDDKEDIILQKRFLVYQALLMSVGGILWGILAVSLGRIWQSSIPFGYVVLSAANLMFFQATSNFQAAKNIQTGISLLLPFLFQWFLPVIVQRVIMIVRLMKFSMR